MRADRLLSLLMILQTRGKTSAARLAEELEVSERTIYRDIAALGVAGVPVYAERGPGGGCALLESYRTNLTGLSAGEVQALFMLSIPAPLNQLGVSQELRAALLKLSASLPGSQRQVETRSRQRILLDSSWWFQGEDDAPFLQIVHQACWQDRRLHVRLRLEFGAEMDWVVDPLGLIAKTTVWYLAAARQGSVRAYRISSLVDAQMLDETFIRPPDFDLERFWQAWRQHVEDSQPVYRTKLRIAPLLIPHLARAFGENTLRLAAHAGPPDAEGWITLDLPFEGLDAARSRILGLGRAVEVIEPLALRLSVQDFAEQALTVYAKAPGRSENR